MSKATAIGLLAGRMAAAERLGECAVLPPPDNGARRADRPHHRRPSRRRKRPGSRSFQPMNVNFGLFPPVDAAKPEGVKRWRGTEKTEAKKRAITSRALAALAAWL